MLAAHGQSVEGGAPNPVPGRKGPAAITSSSGRGWRGEHLDWRARCSARPRATFSCALLNFRKAPLAGSQLISIASDAPAHVLVPFLRLLYDSAVRAAVDGAPSTPPAACRARVIGPRRCAFGVWEVAVDQAQQEVGSCSPGSKSLAVRRRLSLIVR